MLHDAYIKSLRRALFQLQIEGGKLTRNGLQVEMTGTNGDLETLRVLKHTCPTWIRFSSSSKQDRRQQQING